MVLVRVRGKKGNQRQCKDDLKRRQKQPKLSLSNADTMDSSLSILERLPVEILETIFLLCPNLNLPASSPVLGTKLASKHIRMQLVTTYFASTHEDHGTLQTSLLRQMWLTYEFLRDAQQTYMMRRAAEAFLCFAGDDFGDQLQAQLVKLQSLVLGYFHRGSAILEPVGMMFELKDWVRDTGFTATKPDGREFQAWLYSQRYGEAALLCTHTGSIDLDKKHLVREFDLPQAGRYHRFPAFAESCRIPAKLLHGPFTQTKGDFLKLLVDGDLHPDDENIDLAGQGLMEAIATGCGPAIKCLVRECRRQQPPVAKVAGASEGDVADDRWISLSGKHNVRSLNIGLEPEHIICCLDHFDHNPSLYLTLLREHYPTARLYPGAKDTLDNELYVWARDRRDVWGMRVMHIYDDTMLLDKTKIVL